MADLYLECNSGISGDMAVAALLDAGANGISVVNIDNGFGAGYIATQINRLAEKGKTR